MVYYTQYAVALWDKQFEELSDQSKRFLSTYTKKNEVETPDETYLVFYWEFLQDGTEDHIQFLHEVEYIRHAIIGIREDGEIIQDTMDYDSWGTDEEFNDILGWKGEIVMWNDPSCELVLIDNMVKMQRIAELCEITLEDEPTDEDLDYDDAWIEVYAEIHNLKEALKNVGF